MDEHEVLSRLHQQIVARSDSNVRRDRFVRAKERLHRTGFTVPTSMEDMQIALDWPRKAVEVFASRQVPLGYSTRTPTTMLDDLADVFEASNVDFLERQAIQAADHSRASRVETLASGSLIVPASSASVPSMTAR